MRNKYFGSAISATPPTYPSTERPAEQASPNRRGGKKLYVVIAAAAIVILLVAVMMAPQGSANVISLGVDYSVGEKLTYDMAVTLSLGFGNASSAVSEANLGLTVEVLSFDGETYTLNYSVVLPKDNPNVTLNNPNVTSRVLEVQKNEMVTLLALLPVVLQAGVSGNESANSPLLTAVFDKSQAMVGDTWQIPLNAEGSSSGSFQTLTVTFNGIEDLTVRAGTFRVFSLDFLSSYQKNQNDSIVFTELSGQAHLEYGSCKQIQSNLQITASSRAGGLSYTIGTVITSTLTQDLKP